MKKIIQNGVCLSVLLLLLFTLLPVGVMAEDHELQTPNAATSGIDTKDFSLDIEYSCNSNDGFKVNSFTATRINSKILLTINYESNRDCDFSLFNSPNGDLLMKIVNSGIKKGTNTIEIELTLDELKQVLTVDALYMKFGFDSQGSILNFKTAQLKPLQNETFDGSVQFFSDYKDGFIVNTFTAKRSNEKIIFTLNYTSSRDCGYNLFNPRDGDILMKTNYSGIKKGTNTVEIDLTLDELKRALTVQSLTLKFGLDENGSAIFFNTTQLKYLLNEDPINSVINPTNITLSKTTSNLSVNESEKLTTTLTPASVTDTTIIWSSSDSTIAAVDSNGNITGVKMGTATITATTNNNLTTTCQVIVSSPSIEKNISYQTHVQNVGWQDLKTNGDMSGTSGQSLRLEGIKIQLNNYENLGVEYQTHVQNIGWQGFKSTGVMSGTSGLSLRLEAIQIKLTGSNAANYDIYYQVHAQNVGWMGWAKNGESAGTAGYSYRLEGIRIKVVPKGDPAPNDNVTNTNPFNENIAAPYAPILQEYKVAEANNFSSELIWNSLKNVNTEIINNKGALYYTVEDISGDSIPELVIASYSTQYGYHIYDIYRLVGDKPERIFDVYTMGYRSIYTICENKIIKMRGSGGAFNYGYKFYKLDKNTATTYQEIEYDGFNGVPKYFLTDAKNNNRLISETEAKNIINSYIPRSDIKWIKL